MATYRPADFSGLIGDYQRAYATSLAANEARRTWEMQDADRAVKGLNTFETIWSDEMDKFKAKNGIEGDLTTEQAERFESEFSSANPALLENVSSIWEEVAGPTWAENGETDSNSPIKVVKSAIDRAKYILTGKNAKGETVPKTQNGTSDPNDPILQLSPLELARNSRYVIATKYGLDPFSDMQMASRSVGARIDSNGSAAANTAVASGETAGQNNAQAGLRLGGLQNNGASAVGSNAPSSGGGAIHYPSVGASPNTPMPGTPNPAYSPGVPMAENIANGALGAANMPSGTQGQMTEDGQVLVDDGTNTGNSVPVINTSVQPLVDPQSLGYSNMQTGPVGPFQPDQVADPLNPAQFVEGSYDNPAVLARMQNRSRNGDDGQGNLNTTPVAYDANGNEIPSANSAYDANGNSISQGRQMADDRFKAQNPERTRNATPEETQQKWTDKETSAVADIARDKKIARQASEQGKNERFWVHEARAEQKEKELPYLRNAAQRNISDAQYEAEKRYREKVTSDSAAAGNVTEEAKAKIDDAQSNPDLTQDQKDAATTAATLGTNPSETDLIKEGGHSVATGEKTPEEVGGAIAQEVGYSGVNKALTALIETVAANNQALSQSLEGAPTNLNNVDDFVKPGVVDPYTGSAAHPGTQAERMVVMAMATKKGFMPAGAEGLAMQRYFIQTGRLPAELTAHWEAKKASADAVESLVNAQTAIAKEQREGMVSVRDQLEKTGKSLLDNEQQEVEIAGKRLDNEGKRLDNEKSEQDAKNAKITAAKAAEEAKKQNVTKATKQLRSSIEETVRRISEEFYTRGGAFNQSRPAGFENRQIAPEELDIRRQRLINDVTSFFENNTPELIQGTLNQLEIIDPPAFKAFMDDLSANGMAVADINDEMFKDLLTKTGMNLDALAITVGTFEQAEDQAMDSFSGSIISKVAQAFGYKKGRLQMQDYLAAVYAKSKGLTPDALDRQGYSAMKNPLSKLIPLGLGPKSQEDEVYAALHRAAGMANMPTDQLDSFILGMGKIYFNKMAIRMEKEKKQAIQNDQATQ